MPGKNDPSVRSWCLECSSVVPATLRENNGNLYLKRCCTRHDLPETLFWKNANLFKPFPPSAGDMLPEGPLDPFDPRLDSFVTTLAIDLTSRCNLNCPACVAQALSSDQKSTRISDPTFQELLDMIPDYRGRKKRPVLCLFGGEPTLREDLPDLIRAVILEKGLVPRLCTNGVLLGKNNRLRQLRKAGLRWIILQFDGFKSESSLALRGIDLSRMKMDLIDQISSHGIAIHLAVMVKKGVNDQEIGEILRFAAANSKISRVSFYPCSGTGRANGGQQGMDVTHVDDVLLAIEAGTNGMIRQADFLATKTLAGKLFKLTRFPMLRPRPCLFPILLLRRGGVLKSCHKLFSLRGFLADSLGFLTLLRNGPGLLNQYEGRFSSDFLFITIEKLYDDHAFLADAARNCHYLYLTPQGIVPFCVYNSCLRNRSGSI